jgi:hypothetical protein
LLRQPSWTQKHIYSFVSTLSVAHHSFRMSATPKGTKETPE